MSELLVQTITKDSEFTDDIFQAVFDCPDEISREKLLKKIKDKCKKVGRTREFNVLFKQYKEEMLENLEDENSNLTEFEGQKLQLECSNYIADEHGVKRIEITKDFKKLEYVVCPHPITVSARFINLDTGLEKVQIDFYKDGKWRNLIVDNSMILNSKNISNLSDRGVMITSENAKEVVKYFFTLLSLNQNKIPLFKSINRLGWIENDFAPYCDDIHYDGELEFKFMYDCVKTEGDFETWKNHVFYLCRDYLPIRIMCAVSLASVLISKVGALPFVFHLWGTTGFGKTVSLMIAASIWGNPEVGKLTQSMNQTSNAIARKSAFLNSICFCADELQQIKDRWGTYDKLIMFLTEGQDRGRAKAYGGVEQVSRWCNSFIFTGEEPVTKQNSGGGVKNRVIEMEVKDKIIKDGNKTANLLKENYGHAGKLFIKKLQEYENVDALLKGMYQSYFNDILKSTDTTDKQASSMALILMADELSRVWLWDGAYPELKISDVSNLMSSASEVDISVRAYEWVINWIAEHQINFVSDSNNSTAGKVYGKILAGKTLNTKVCCINKNVLIQSMAEQGFEFDSVKRKWAENGWILRDSRGKLATRASVNGSVYTSITINLPC